MRELDDETGIGLIEKRRQGFGKVNVIYVKTFMPEKTDEKKFDEELQKFKKKLLWKMKNLQKFTF